MADQDAAFRLLFANNPLPMWVYDLKTLCFLEVNEAALEQYGYARDEFLAMKIIDIRPPEDVPRLLDNVARERPGLQHSGEWRHRLKSGEVIDVQVASHTLEFDGREAALVVAQNITDRKRAESLVWRQLENLTALNDSARRFSESLNLHQLTHDIVRVCGESFGLRLAWVGYADADGALRLLAHHPPDVGYPHQAISQWNESAKSRGITGQVLRSNTPMIVQDISTSPDPPPVVASRPDAGNSVRRILPTHQPYSHLWPSQPLQRPAGLFHAGADRVLHHVRPPGRRSVGQRTPL